jgi:hypothetical protein
MTVDLISKIELIRLWHWILENPELHQDDAGPKTFDDFQKNLQEQDITVLAARKGNKFIGAIGFKPETGYCMIRGIHFDKSVRGSGDACVAVAGLISICRPYPVRLKYFADNPYMPGFVRKLGGVNIEGGGSAIRGGKEIAFQMVEFNDDQIITDCRLRLNP